MLKMRLGVGRVPDALLRDVASLSALHCAAEARRPVILS